MILGVLIGISPAMTLATGLNDVEDLNLKASVANLSPCGLLNGHGPLHNLGCTQHGSSQLGAAVISTRFHYGPPFLKIFKYKALQIKTLRLI